MANDLRLHRIAIQTPIALHQASEIATIRPQSLSKNREAKELTPQADGATQP